MLKPLWASAGFTKSWCTKTKAVAASPKMKWLSRSRKFKWAVQISAFTINTRLAEPAAMALAAICTPNVALEQATFMSNAKPPQPNSDWISTAMAG